MEREAILGGYGEDDNNWLKKGNVGRRVIKPNGHITKY